MDYKRILTIQDISCVGQCSLTVALPIISACGIETSILPSAVLSTHTGGFTGFTFRDLTDDMPLIEKHWNKEGIKFDAIYTGYLGSARQIDIVLNIINTTLKPNSPIIIDPAMADNGKLYFGFDDNFVTAMAKLCAKADYVLPNITEACFITKSEYRTEYDQAYIMDLLQKLVANGSKNVILTGVSYKPETTGVVVYENGKYQYYEHRKIAQGSHGTGDVYASAFAGALLNNKSAYESAKIAADYTVKCIENTQDGTNHWYGCKFETGIPDLLKMLGK